MITITDEARDKLLELVAAKNLDGFALRIAIRGRGPYGFVYDMQLVEEDEKQDDDILAEVGELRVIIDGGSADNLKGSTLDFIPMAGSFKIDNPNPLWSDPLAQAVQDVIIDQVNPAVASHGGFVTLLEVRDNVAYVQLGGGCVGCSMVSTTLKQGVEAMITEAVPQIEKVVDTTDHASGTNPYYQPAKGGRSPLA